MTATRHLGAHTTTARPAPGRHRAPRRFELRRRVAEAGLALGLMGALLLGALHAEATHPAMDRDPAPAAAAATR